MDEEFDIPILFNRKQLQFKSKLIAYGYVHKFEVNVNGLEVRFKPDEERF